MFAESILTSHCRPELPLVPAPPIFFCWLSVECSLAIDLLIATLSLMYMQSKLIHMVGGLGLSIILVLGEVIIVIIVPIVIVVVIGGLRNCVGLSP
jgi:hypothetical protein